MLTSKLKLTPLKLNWPQPFFSVWPQSNHKILFCLYCDLSLWCLLLFLSDRLSLGHIWLDAECSTSWNPGVSSVWGSGGPIHPLQWPCPAGHGLLPRRIRHRKRLPSSTRRLSFSWWPAPSSTRAGVWGALRHIAVHHAGAKQRPL